MTFLFVVWLNDSKELISVIILDTMPDPVRRYSFYLLSKSLVWYPKSVFCLVSKTVLKGSYYAFLQTWLSLFPADGSVSISMGILHGFASTAMWRPAFPSFHCLWTTFCLNCWRTPWGNIPVTYRSMRCTHDTPPLLLCYLNHLILVWQDKLVNVVL